MAYRLKDRNRPIPNGLRFVQPETNWQPPRYASFDVVVRSLISHRKSRPDLVAAKKWALDYDSVANEVDAFNAVVAIRHGWSDYVIDGSIGEAPPPKSQALLQQEKNVIAAAAGKAKKIWDGATLLNDWLDSGEPPVDSATSEIRASACAKCPRNGKGGFDSWFTRPASEMIKKQLERITGMKLQTTHDAQINICEICLCPLKVKVHTPVKFVRSHTKPEVMAELRAVPGCWVPKEVA